MQHDEKPAKPSKKLVLTRETIRVLTGLKAGDGGYIHSPPATTRVREFEPEETTT